MFLSERSLFVKLPELAHSWHPTRNDPLRPRDVTPGSGKRVWWVCKKGHEWLAVIKNRTKGAGCPYCSGRYGTPETGLAAIHPRLAREWHPSKNAGLTPHRVRPGSHRKVWWRCHEGHEWQAMVKHRTLGTGCPFCAGKRVALGKDLASLHPEVAGQWHLVRNHGQQPGAFLPQSNKKVWWICGRGHEWQARIQDRTRGTGCPYCTRQTSQLEVRIYSELKSILGNVVCRRKFDGTEIDVYIPGENIAIEVDGTYWHRRRYRIERKKQLQLRKRGIRLVRLREKPLRKLGKADVLFATREDHSRIVARLMNSLLGLVSSPHRPLLKGYVEKGQLQNANEYHQLLACLPGPPPEESLAVLYPKVAAEWSYERNTPLSPEQFAVRSNRKVWWRCKKGHEWTAVIHTRTKGIGCPYCSGRLATSETSLLTKRPDLAREWHPARNARLQPNEVTPFSHKRVWWLCGSGHEWQAIIANRASANECPYCSGRRASSQQNLARSYPNLALQWHPDRNRKLRPESITPGSGRKVWWRCHRGHEWRAAIYTRTAGRGCPYCAGKLPTPEENLVTIFPNLAREWHPTKNRKLRPTDVRPRSARKVWWLCKKGHEWKATVNNRSFGKGCPVCAGKRT